MVPVRQPLTPAVRPAPSRGVPATTLVPVDPRRALIAARAPRVPAFRRPAPRGLRRGAHFVYLVRADDDFPRMRAPMRRRASNHDTWMELDTAAPGADRRLHPRACGAPRAA
ncbi:MAG TPA: hypothetical protein VF006_10950 [Longimicrobium sp.]